MLQQWSRLPYAAFEANTKVFPVEIRRKLRIQNDCDATIVFGGKLAHRQSPHARSGFPVDMAQIVARLVITKQQEIVSKAAAKRSRLPGVERQQMQHDGHRLGFWINNNINVARAQAATMPKKTEGKARRKFET